MLTLLLCFAMGSSFSQVLSDLQQSKIEQLVKRDVPDQAPGVAFGIVKEGKVVYTQYEGYANLDNQQVIDPATRFNIASNAKQYTALAILMLIEEGKLDLEDDIREFFPNLLPGINEKIQIRHLITHTSGIRDFYELLSLQNITWWKKTLSNKNVIEILVKQDDLNFKPGSDYIYSNSNYILLAEIIEIITKQSFSDYLNILFQNLGMPNTKFAPNHNKIQEPIARPYFNFNTWTGYDWIWDVVGDGNLFTTLPDQLQFEKILQSRKSDFLNEEIIERSQRKVIDSIDYGYGIEFSKYKGYPITFHHGGTGAWKATFMRIPNENISLMTLSNSGKTDVVDQNQRIAEILLGIGNSEDNNYRIAPEKEGDLVDENQITGFYQDNYGTTFQFVNREDGIYLIRSGRNDVKLERENKNTLHQVNDPAFKQEFKKNGRGQLTVTAYYPSHRPYTLTQIASDFTGFKPEFLQGNYFNKETEMEIDIRYLEENKYQVKIGTYQTKGLLLTKEKMLVDNYTITFNNNDCLLLDGDRIRNINFIRKT